MSLHRRTLLGAAGSAAWAAPARAQAFPQRPIRFICPFPAGGIVDIVMRAVSEEVGAALGQPVVIDARPGAGGLIGSQALVSAPADGHTWMMATLSHLVAPLLARAPFHPAADVQGLAVVSHSISLVVVKGESPARRMADFVAQAKAAPGRLNYLRPGNGSFGHITMEMLKRSTGINVQAVDYRGLPPGIVDLLAGRLDIAFLSTGLAMPHIREGKLHAIATIGPMRAPELPDLPTLAEQGIADANVDSWYAAIAPRGVPEQVVARIGDAFTAALGMPSVQAKLRAAGTSPASPRPPAEVQALLLREYDRYATLVREANIRAD